MECTIKGPDRLVQSVEQMGSIRSEIFPTASKCVQLVHSLTRKCYFPSKKLQKSSILTLKADEVSISTPLLTCQTLKKSILRKISLDHSKKLKQTDELDTTSTSFHDILDA